MGLSTVAMAITLAVFAHGEPVSWQGTDLARTQDSRIPVEVLERFAVVHVPEVLPGDVYPVYSTIPALLFHHDGVSYASPIVGDISGIPVIDYLIEDWAAYLDKVGSGGSLIFVGK